MIYKGQQQPGCPDLSLLGAIIEDIIDNITEVSTGINSYSN